MGTKVTREAPPRVLPANDPEKVTGHTRTSEIEQALIEVVNEDGVVIDGNVIPKDELRSMIAGSGALGTVRWPSHPLVKKGRVPDKSDTITTLQYMGITSGGLGAAGFGGVFLAELLERGHFDVTTVLFLAASLLILIPSAVCCARNKHYISRTHRDILEEGFNNPQWRHLLKKMTEDCDETQLQQGLEQIGITWDQLANELRPERVDGTPITGKVVREFFTDIRDNEVGDYVGHAFAIRALGPIIFSKRALTEPSEYFMRLTNEMTERPLPAELISENPAEITPKFCQLMGRISYTAEGSSIPSFILMGAHLMEYHVSATTGSDNAKQVLASIKKYLDGDLNAAYRAQSAVLSKLEERDDSIEAVGVAALHHLVMAELIDERIQGIETSDKPLKALPRQVYNHAHSAIKGLSGIIGTGYINNVRGVQMMMGRAQAVLHRVAAFIK